MAGQLTRLGLQRYKISARYITTLPPGYWLRLVARPLYSFFYVVANAGVPGLPGGRLHGQDFIRAAGLYRGWSSVFLLEIQKAPKGAFFTLDTFLSPAAWGQFRIGHRFSLGRCDGLRRHDLWTSGRPFQGTSLAPAGETA
jgi:hypothetical protein